MGAPMLSSFVLISQPCCAPFSSSDLRFLDTMSDSQNPFVGVLVPCFNNAVIFFACTKILEI